MIIILFSFAQKMRPGKTFVATDRREQEKEKKRWKKNEANNKTGRGKVERPQRGLVCFFFIKKKTKKKRARPSDRKMKLAGR